MKHEELSPEARKALAQCYRLLIQWGHDAQAAEDDKEQTEQPAVEAILMPCASPAPERGGLSDDSGA